MSDFNIRKQALEREENRATRIAAATKDLPKRKSGEIQVVCALLNQMHKTLCLYDLMGTPPPLAGCTETWFDAALARLAEIVAAAQPSSGDNG